MTVAMPEGAAQRTIPATRGPVEGVYLSTRLDLAAMFGPAFANLSDHVRLRAPEAIEDPSSIRLALAWLPEANAFARYPNLALVASIAAGVDSLLACPSLPADVMVTRVRDDSQGHLMAGFAAWHVVWHHRNMRAILADWQNKTWQWRGHPRHLAPSRRPIGVLGFGLMGRAIARALVVLGFPVLAASRVMPATPEPGVTVFHGDDAIDKVAEQATMLINVLPLTHATRGVLNRRLFARMPRGAVLIQLGRGDHLVEADLDEALNSGQLSGASLDVFQTEPLPAEHHWWRDPRILMTPHLASDTSPEFVAEQVVDALAEALAGRVPFNAVSRKNGY